MSCDPVFARFCCSGFLLGSGGVAERTYSYQGVGFKSLMTNVVGPTIDPESAVI